MISDNARAGMQQAPARSLFNALGFTPEEMTLILDILKDGKSKEEREQIDRTINMTSSLFRKHNGK